MKYLLFICAGLLLLAIANLPIGYFTFLRIVVTIGAVCVIINEIENGLNFWVIAFGLIAIIFNPIMPIYLNNKSAWIFIDVVASILFLIKFFTLKNHNK